MPKSFAEAENIQLQYIDYGSDAYYLAVQFRHQLFYQEHNIPLASIFDSQEEQYLHLAIIESSTKRVLAYGQLSQNSCSEFQISQMVVEPEYQGYGFGTCILQVLVKAAIRRGASLVMLNARVTKTGFYQKFGFQAVGEIFASSKTGVPHIRMQKVILQ